MSSNPRVHPSHAAIALRAFRLWTQEEQPLGNGERHWLQAESELRNGAGVKPNTSVGTARNACPRRCKTASSCAQNTRAEVQVKRKTYENFATRKEAWS
jgi:hypothetical protein